MKRIVRTVSAVLSLVLILGICWNAYLVYAGTSWTESQIEAEYELFSEFAVPQREVVVNGKQVKAEAVVKKPDGSVTKADTVKLDTAGKYTVTYTASAEGKNYMEEETFLVHNNLYSFTSEESGASYGKYEHAQSTEGLMVRLAEGDTFTLNEPIDMTALKENEWLIQAFVTPDAVGHADFKKLCFQFTDINDPDVTLYISARQADWDETIPYTYYVAGGNDQTPKGYEVGSKTVHEEGYFGAVGWHSFGLGHELCTPYCDEQTMDFRVDFSTMGVYAKEGMIIDLDSPEYFDTVWEGFPSGQAYLTIWADYYVGKTANFCLYKAGNIDLTRKKIVDTEPPAITIHTEYETAPQAVKGGCYQYIPEASAKDLSSGTCEVTTTVYYNYQSPDASLVHVEDGTFQTDRIGYYAIVYEATDAFGNLGREILWIKAEDSLQKPVISLKEKPETKWVLGEKFIPADYTYECYSGNPTVDVYAEKDGKTYDLNDGFRFEEEGTYQITYELTDCAGQKAVYEYELEVKLGDRPVLGQDILMPQYMVEGSSYVFPTVYFNDYRSGKKEQKVAEGRIIDASGEKKVAAGDTYEVSADNQGDNVRIVFECENASCEVQLPVVKSWGQENGRSVILLENYFVGSGFSCERTEGITFKATDREGGWCFANQLLAEGFSATIQGSSENTAYESLVFELRDSENAEEVLTVELPYTAGVFSVKTGEKVKVLKKGSDLATAGPVSIEYKGGVLYVAGAKIKNTDFSGFSSDYIYLSARFKGAGNHAAFTLLSLNNHNFGTSRTDKEAPKIVVKGNYGGSYQYGDEIALPAVVAGDVLNPNITFSMTVTLGDEVVKDVDGMSLKEVDPTCGYVIKAEEYGRYIVTCTAYDSFSEKEETLSYIIHVTDDVMPKIEFSQKQAEEATVGDTICIPDYTVSDNATEKEKLSVRKYVEDPHGVLISLPENSNAVIASKAGKYKFVILVRDEADNVCNVSWTVTVAGNE